MHLERFKHVLIVDLELGGGGVSESSRLASGSGDLIISVIIVSDVVQKTPSQKQKGGRTAF